LILPLRLNELPDDMLRYLTTLLLVLSVLQTYSQENVKQTIVLNDGSRITGTIISNSTEYITIKVTRPGLMIINKENVADISSTARSEMPEQDYHGYNIAFSAGILAGRSETGKQNSLSILMSNAYQLRNGLSIGIGSGIENFDVIILPLYADFRYHPFRSRVSPYAWMKCGYGFTVSENGSTVYDYYGYGDNSRSQGGILFNTGAGIALYSWRKNAVTLGIGYRFQKISYKQERYYWRETGQSELITQFNRIDLRFGFIFR